MPDEPLELILSPSGVHGGMGDYYGRDESIDGFPPAFDERRVSAIMRVEKSYGQQFEIFDSALGVGYVIFSLGTLDPTSIVLDSCRLTAVIDIGFNWSSSSVNGELVEVFWSTLTSMAAEWLDDPANPLPTATMYQPDDTSGDAIAGLDLESFFEGGSWSEHLGNKPEQLTTTLDLELPNAALHVNQPVFGLRFAIVGTPTLHPFTDEERPDGTYVTLRTLRLHLRYTLTPLEPLEIEAAGTLILEGSARARVDPARSVQSGKTPIDPIYHRLRQRRGH